MDETNQTISVQDNVVVVSTPQPPVEVSYSREVLIGMCTDCQARIDYNMADLENYKSMLALLPEPLKDPVVETPAETIE